MKTITKTFYCTYEFYKELQANDVGKLNTIKGDCWTIPIQISWQEPERKIEIIESEFQERLRKSVPINWTNELIEEITNRFFGE